ncbi:MAG TPA: flagellar basal body rod protein FlgB [Nitrospirota bacterium]|nr:flagellar basal body rod protein FlgB [Nitrospirota bacterium]
MSDSMKILERLVQQTGIRHGVLASNIANVDTPNYRARDVSFGQVLGSEMHMVTTDPQHLQAGESAAGAGEVQGEDSRPWADKNNVEMDLEVAKMTENAMLMEAAVTLLTKKIQMYKNAMKTSG